MKKCGIWVFLFLYLAVIFVFAFVDFCDMMNYRLYTIGLKKDRFEYLPPDPESPSVFERQGVWLTGYGPDYMGLLVYATAGAITAVFIRRILPYRT